MTETDALEGVIIVLDETQDYVNIAGAIRAMKNFGLFRLRLVAPAEWDPWRIEGIAHDTGDIVSATTLYESLPEALGDCSLVVGMTARERRAKRVTARPREIAPELLEHANLAASGETGPVAILFGREDRGLTNEKLDLCHRTVTIPTNPDHPSLNLAQAVLVIAYELWMAQSGAAQPFRGPRRSAPPASVDELEVLFADVEAALRTIDFFKTRKVSSVLRTLRDLAHRSDLDAREAAFLRAMAIEVVKYVRRMRD